jgi:hypothetical protein
LVHAAAIVAAPILTANLIAAIWRRLDGSLRRRSAITVTAIEGSILIAAIWRRLDGGLRRRRSIAAIKAPVLIAATWRRLDGELRRWTAVAVAPIGILTWLILRLHGCLRSGTPTMIAAIRMPALWRSRLA